LQRDEAPIASHLLFTQPGILRDDIPEERKRGVAAGRAWLEVADAMVAYADHGMSPGMADAIDEANRKGISVLMRFIGK
jgi:LDH2 family malate/lactate/ureidoglycolate dehydrogenase